VRTDSRILTCNSTIYIELDSRRERMPKTKKQLFPKNLLDYEVLIEDTSANSEYFQITGLPQIFTGGRNSFLIDGSSFLLDGSQLQIEMLDINGNTIYHNAVKNYVEGTSILISVFVYNDTSNGFGKIVIMGKANSTVNGEPIPQEWQDIYNVRWTKQIMIEPLLRSRSPIKFLNQPIVSTEEKRYYTVATSSFTTSSIPFTASLSPILNSAEQVGYLVTAQSPTSFSADYFGAYITGSIIVDGISGSVELLIDDLLDTSSIFSKKSIITLNDGRIIENILLRSGSYTTTVFNNATSQVTSSTLLKYEKLNITNSNIPVSYAKLRVTDINTVSGEIFKVKAYSKVSTNISEYKLIADVPIVTENLIVTESIRGELSSGDFYVSPTASQNWYSNILTSSTNLTYPISGTAAYYNSGIGGQFSVSVGDTPLMSSMFASVPTNNNRFSGSVSSSGYFIGTIRPVRVFSTTEYTLELDAVYKKQSGSVDLTGNTPLVNIYIIGSGSTPVISDDPLGQLIGTLAVESGAETRRFESVQFNFYPNVTTSANVGLRFQIQNGFWNFSNISLKPASDILFAPDEAQFLIPNTEHFNSILEYKIEFFDINNNSPDVVAISTPTFFTGSNIDLGTLP